VDFQGDAPSVSDDEMILDSGLNAVIDRQSSL
jgi:hypothetical protein